MDLYVALLRGINVGGKNRIKMADLAAFFEASGFTSVRTYIQSGNVLFRARDADRAKLTVMLEEGLSKTFSYELKVVVRSYNELKEIVTQAPEGYGGEPSIYRYDVIFFKEPLASSEAVKSMPLKEGVDQVFAGNGVIYTARLTARATQSRISQIVYLPFYQDITIRNWNTTTRLLNMMEEERRQST